MRFHATAVVIMFFLQPVSLAFPSFTEGVNLYLDHQDEEYGLITSIISPMTSNPLQYSSFTSASRILVLGDGFNRKWTQNAEYFQSILPLNVDIYKTDIECSKDLDGMSKTNLHYKRVDHNRQFPFQDGLFDVISMSYGLCICKCSYISCGGIDFSAQKSGLFSTICFRSRIEDENSFNFFSETARVLNSKNLKAIAFLHGPDQGRKNPRLKSFENRKLHLLTQIVPSLETEFPLLDFKLVFFQIENDWVFQGVFIRVR